MQIVITLVLVKPAIRMAVKYLHLPYFRLQANYFIVSTYFHSNILKIIKMLYTEDLTLLLVFLSVPSLLFFNKFSKFYLQYRDNRNEIPIVQN